MKLNKSEFTPFLAAKNWQQNCGDHKNVCKPGTFKDGDVIYCSNCGKLVVMKNGEFIYI